MKRISRKFFGYLKFMNSYRPFSSNYNFSKYSKNNGNSELRKDDSLQIKNTLNKREEISEFIKVLKDQKDFQKEVVDCKVPVILDLFAKWCEPCKKLTPLLEKEAEEANGKFKLLKIDIDLFPEIASSLQVRQIPFVLLALNGNAIDAFTGYPTEEKLKSFFELVYSTGSKFVQSKTPEGFYSEILDYILKGKFDEATKFIVTIDVNQWSALDRSQLKLICSIIHWQHQKRELAIEYYNEAIQENGFEYFIENKSWISTNPYIIEKIKEIQDLILKTSGNEIENILAESNQLFLKNPDNLELKFKHAQNLNAYLHNEEAINLLLEVIFFLRKIIKKEKNWDEGAAKKLILNIFQELGGSNILVQESRKKLQRLLN